MRCGGGFKTKHWDTAAAKAIPCGGPVNSSLWLQNVSVNTGHTKIRGLLEAGDPYGEVRDAWHAKENVRDIYAIYDPATGKRWVEQLAGDFQSPAMPEEINQLGRTLRRWYHEITNWFKARVTNGPTEAVNNLIKRVKRVAFAFHQL